MSLNPLCMRQSVRFSFHQMNMLLSKAYFIKVNIAIWIKPGHDIGTLVVVCVTSFIYFNFVSAITHHSIRINMFDIDSTTDLGILVAYLFLVYTLHTHCRFQSMVRLRFHNAFLWAFSLISAIVLMVRTGSFENLVNKFAKTVQGQTSWTPRQRSVFVSTWNSVQVLLS